MGEVLMGRSLMNRNLTDYIANSR